MQERKRTKDMTVRESFAQKIYICGLVGSLFPSRACVYDNSCYYASMYLQALVVLLAPFVCYAGAFCINHRRLMCMLGDAFRAQDKAAAATASRVRLSCRK